MNRWIQTLTCIGIITTANSLFGWSGGSLQSTTPSKDPAEIKHHFPLNEDQQWYVKETYLILKPYEDDNDYATRLHTKQTPSNISMSMKLQKPDFDWYSGVRVGVGRYLANHDRWDISLFTTYFYAEEEDSSNPKRSNGTLLTPLWSPTFDGGATKGRATWRLNFFNWDLSAGREYNVLSTLVAHPFIGLRGALIYKDYKATYSDSLRSGGVNQLLSDKFDASDRFWGIGPRAGVDFQFIFKKSWSFLGSLSTSLFYGNFKVSQKTDTSFVYAGSSNKNHFKSSNNEYSVRANLDTSIGMGWEKWLSNHSVRLMPSVLFEATCWFDTNEFFATHSTRQTLQSSSPNFTNYRRHGNLILMGFSLNLQADF